MYTQEELMKMVFFDFETAPEYESFEVLQQENPEMAVLWSKRCEYLRSKFEENKDLSDSELYITKAALNIEFMRIVCASFGRITYMDGIPNMIIKSYSGESESTVLAGILQVFGNPKLADGYKFVGHNIKRFDIPVMCKRLVINGFNLPKLLHVHNQKPWEIPFIDTSEVWSFGAWQEGFASLELILTSLGLETPKDDIRGEDVGRVFWEENDLPRIERYCEKDVYALAQAVLKMSGNDILDGYENQETREQLNNA